VSIDRFTSSIAGNLAHTKGCENPEEKHTGGTFFVDHSSCDIFVQLQVSQRAGETIIGKNLFQNSARAHGVNILHYHTDNGICSLVEF